MNDLYTKRVTYVFECGGETWEVKEQGVGWMGIGETRCNGQEDSHVDFIVHCDDGKWDFEDPKFTRSDIKMYRYEGLADELLALINEHGAP